LTLSHPTSDLNAIDEAMFGEISTAVRELHGERRARAVLLRANGRAFSAGGDFAWLDELRAPGHLEAHRRDAKQLIFDFLDCEIPIVAAVHGSATGLGASLALMCDAIFLAENARLSDPHVRVGIVAGAATFLWPLAMGPARAKKYLLTGDVLTAFEAERLGLVTDVVPEEELQRAALAFTERLAAGAPLALRHTKIAVNKLIKDAMNAAFDMSMPAELLTFHSEDFDEAIVAIRERRTPRFQGR
jgi:enoyl-CoA hydratase